MKRLGRFSICLLMALLTFNISSSQVLNFKSFRENQGVVTPKSKGMYIWGPWEQSSTNIMLNMSKNRISTIDDLTKKKNDYEVFEKPKKWVVKRNYKYVNFECMNVATLEKIFIKLYEYDSGEFRVTVMSSKRATRYSVVYIKDENSEENEELMDNELKPVEEYSNNFDSYE